MYMFIPCMEGAIVSNVYSGLGYIMHELLRIVSFLFNISHVYKTLYKRYFSYKIHCTSGDICYPAYNIPFSTSIRTRCMDCIWGIAAVVMLQVMHVLGAYALQYPITRNKYSVYYPCPNSIPGWIDTNPDLKSG